MKKIIIVCFTIIVIAIPLYFMQANKTDTLSGPNLWQGTWTSDRTGKTGGIQFTFNRNGEGFTGVIKISGSNLTKGGDIEGKIEDDKITFGMSNDKKGKLLYTGTISNNKMLGRWQIPLAKDQGDWQASRG